MAKRWTFDEGQSEENTLCLASAALGPWVPSSISDPVAAETNPRDKGILLEGDLIVPATATALGAATADARDPRIRGKAAVTVHDPRPCSGRSREEIA